MPHVPDEIRCLSLYTISDLIRSHEDNQVKFAECVIIISPRPEHSGLPNQKPPPGVPTSSLKAIIQTALEKEKFGIRAAACYVLQCYVCNNPEAQLALATTLVSPPTDIPNTKHTCEFSLIKLHLHLPDRY